MISCILGHCFPVFLRFRGGKGLAAFGGMVLVYKVVLTLNYSGDNRIMALHEIDGGLGHSIRIPSAVVHHEKSDLHLQVAFFIMVHIGIEEAGRAQRKGAAVRYSSP